DLVVLQQGRAVVFDTGGRRLRQVPHGNRRFVDRVAMRPDGQRMAIVFEHQLVQYRLPNGEKDWQTKEDDCNGPVTSLAYSGDGKFLIAGVGYGAALFFDARTGERSDTQLTSTFAEVRAVALSPDGLSAAGCAANSLYLWRLGSDDNGEVAQQKLGKTHF